MATKKTSAKKTSTASKGGPSWTVAQAAAAGMYVSVVYDLNFVKGTPWGAESGAAGAPYAVQLFVEAAKLSDDQQKALQEFVNNNNLLVEARSSSQSGPTPTPPTPPVPVGG